MEVLQSKRHIPALTPREERDSDHVAGRWVGKDHGEFEEHQKSIRSHPHGRDECEVMEEGGGHHTDFDGVHLVDTDDKEHEHEDHGHTELESELGVVSLTQFTGERERGPGSDQQLQWLHGLTQRLGG